LERAHCNLINRNRCYKLVQGIISLSNTAGSKLEKLDLKTKKMD